MVYGEKVFLRPVELEDLDNIFNWSGDFEMNEMSSFSINFLNKDQLAYRVKESSNFKNTAEFAIVEKENKKIIGECILKDLDYTNKKCLCSIYIGDNENRDKGYGAEALKLMMRFAFYDLGLNRMGLWVFDFNKRAMRCFKKCGMKVEGIMRDGVYRDGRYHDVYFMGILKREYEEKWQTGVMNNDPGRVSAAQAAGAR